MTYAVWAGAGTALVAGVGVLALGEAMSWAKAASLALVVAGVIGLNVYGGAHDEPVASSSSPAETHRTVVSTPTPAAPVASATPTATASTSEMTREPTDD